MFATTIRTSAASAKEFFDAGWEVSLLVLASCRVAANVVSACVMDTDAEDDKNVVALYKRSGVIAMGGLRDMLGPSFALALELAQGPF
jgi:hypothetical protein